MCISHKIKFFPHLLKIVEKGVCEAGFLVVERSRAVVRKSIMSSHFYGCLLVLKIDFFVAGIRPRRFSIGPCRTILQPKFWAQTFYIIKVVPSFRPKFRTFLPRRKCESVCLWRNCRSCWRQKKIQIKICEIQYTYTIYHEIVLSRKKHQIFGEMAFYTKYSVSV